MTLAQGCTRVFFGSNRWLSHLSAPTAVMALSKIVAVLCGLPLHG